MSKNEIVVVRGSADDLNILRSALDFTTRNFTVNVTAIGLSKDSDLHEFSVTLGDDESGTNIALHKWVQHIIDQTTNIQSHVSIELR